MTVKDIRDKFIELYKNKEFVIDKSGVKTIEIIGASFEADEPYIFGQPNQDYIERELKWYLSQSLNVNDITGKIPAIWQQVADKDGYINSNYGWCIFSDENGQQYNNVLTELLHNPNSRRATMIYNRPTMWKDYNKNGMSDFMCTYAVQYFIRNNTLFANVIMRSNDAWAGYRNDYAWQKWVTEKLMKDINKNIDEKIANYKILWHASSLHLYEKQFKLVEDIYKEI